MDTYTYLFSYLLNVKVLNSIYIYLYFPRYYMYVH